MNKRYLGGLVALALAGCSGNSTPAIAPLPVVTPVPVSSTPIPASTPTPGATSAPQGSVKFTIAVPAPAAVSSRARKPAYISPATGSIRIVLVSPTSAAAPTVAPVAYGASGCTSDKTQPLSCTLTVNAPAGADDSFAITTYASSDGSGAVLAQGAVSTAVDPTNPPTIPLSLNGVVSSVGITPARIHAAPGSAPQAFTVSVTARDASGAVIVGSDDFASPVSLAITNDPSHALTLSSTSLTRPGQLTLTYDSSKTLTHAQVIATGVGTSATEDVTPLRISATSLVLTLGGPAQQITASEDGLTQAPTTAIAVISGSTSGITTSASPPTGGTSTITITPPSAAAANDLQALGTVLISDGFVTASVQVRSLLPQLTFTTAGGYVNVQYPVVVADGTIWTQYESPGERFALARYNALTRTYDGYDLAGFGVNGSTVTTVAGPIVQASDGNLWFAELVAPSVVANTTAQICRFSITTYALTCYTNPAISAINNSPYVIGASGSNVYYLASTGTSTALSVGSINITSGAFSALATVSPAQPRLAASPSTMTGGSTHLSQRIVQTSDGTLWFENGSTSPATLNSLNPTTGAVTSYTVGTGDNVTDLAVDASGSKIWFSAGKLGVGLFDPASKTVANTYTSGLLPANSRVLEIAPTSDNKVWMQITQSTPGTPTLGLLDPSSGTITEYTELSSLQVLNSAATMQPVSSLMFSVNDQLFYESTNTLGGIVFVTVARP